MTKTVIQVNNLSKRYRIGLKEKRHDTFVGQLGAILKAPIDNFRQLRSMSKFGAEDESVFWALKDINFEVKEGEVLGIIGHNGAGKSTLLKILSRITEPTSGEIKIKGRIAALLEVGTGFHPDLTGRENVYMNGTILGMTKREIDAKFDEIVDFSGVEKYIDTPVKFYSSGMKVRLGFAVAAHLEPEILIIDEVLAVGDAEFQRKCLGKMQDVAENEGRTILFVSHNMEAIRRLCTRAILLSKGGIKLNGDVTTTISNYYNPEGNKTNNAIKGIYNLQDHVDKKEKNFGIMKAELYCDGELTDTVYSGSKLEIVLHFEAKRDLFDPEIGIVIKDSNDVSYIGLNNKHLGIPLNIKQGKGKAKISISDFPFYGTESYWMNLYFGDLEFKEYEALISAIKFKVIGDDIFDSGRSLDPKWNRIAHKNIHVENI